MFTVPVVLYIFKRYETVMRILQQMKAVGVNKLYLIGDGPRNENEVEKVLECRAKIEAAIDWPCEIVKNYAEVNRGVYENIGKGAAWVFQYETEAIFLEDDNLPEVSFFEYCSELLNKYKNDESVLWINGTNYLSEYQPTESVDYMFTKQLLPCGWASWSHKYIKYYDGDLSTVGDSQKKKTFFKSYYSKELAKQQWHSILTTKRKLKTGKPVSWDFQMCYSVRANGLFGVSPKFNQIRNIGADSDSTHGGTNMKKTMTARFCEVDSKELSFPLKHPKKITCDEMYERLIEKRILWPISTRIIYRLCYLIKPIIRMNKYDSMSDRLIKRSRGK